MMDLVRATYGRDCDRREANVAGNDAVTEPEEFQLYSFSPSVLCASTVAPYRTDSHIVK